MTVLNFLWLAATLIVCVSSQGIVFGGGGNQTPSRPVAGSPCSPAGGGSGVCGSIRQCPSLGRLVREKPPNFISTLKDAAAKCKGPPLLCCPSSSGGVSTPTGPVVSMRASGPPFRSPRGCGASLFAPPRVVGGNPVASLSIFPWMTALKYRTTEKNKLTHRCGGAIINDRWVLTAGHCITQDGPIAATVRDLRLGTPIEDIFSDPPEDVEIEGIFKHQDYKRVGPVPTNDIALLKLKKSLQFSDILMPICLSEERRTTAEIEAIDRVYIAGWGYTSFGASEPSTEMMWAGVNVTKFQKCQENYARRRYELNEQTQMCAGGDDKDQEGCDVNPELCRGGVDTCRGDSGGPLMELSRKRNRQRWYTVGVVSFGIGCGNPDLPGVYTRLDDYLGWIGDTVRAN